MHGTVHRTELDYSAHNLTGLRQRLINFSLQVTKDVKLTDLTEFWN